MRSDTNGTGRFFFTTSLAPDISESRSVSFPVTISGEFETIPVDMSVNPEWRGYIAMLRFDPIDRPARIEIDSIRLLP
jgi:hypothetical protein